MKKRSTKSWFVAAACLFALWAVVPPASAKYGGGAASGGGMSIYDGEPTEADCRMCHDNLAGFPMLLASNPDRHHALADLNPGEEDCLSCHATVYNEILGAWVVSEIGNCLGCHDASTVVGAPGAGSNVHHETQTFFNRDCGACHNQ